MKRKPRRKPKSKKRIVDGGFLLMIEAMPGK